MTSTPPSPRPEAALAGWRGWGVRSAFAPRPFSRGAIAGVAAVLALGVLEVIAGEEVLVAALLVLPPLVVALTGRWGDTLLVAALALALVLASPLVEGVMQLAISIVLVLAGGIVAVAVAVARTGSVVALERFRLLVGVADVADRADGPDELVEGVLDLLVPVLGDVAAVDVILAGERRRIGVRVAPGIDPEVRAAMARRRDLRGEERSSEASMADDVARLVRPDGALLAAAARSPHDAQLLAGLHIRTALIVPLRARGRVIGAVNTAFGPSGRRHAETDLRFAEVLAGRVALALDNAGLTSELIVAEEQFGVVVRTLAEAVTMNDAEGRIVYANEAAVELLHADSAEELITAAPADVMDRFAVYDEHGRPLRPEDLPSVRLLAGESRAEPLLVRNVVRATHEERWLLHKCSALRDADGGILRIVNVIENVTEVKRAERAQRLLADASEALASSLDHVGQLGALTDVLVPALADWAVLDLPDERGVMQPVAIADTEPGRAALVRRLREHYPVTLAEPATVPAALREGRAELWAEVTDALLAGYARDDEELAMLREIGFGSMIIVPLIAGVEPIGSLTLVISDPLRRFDESERDLAAEIGRRAGVAVSNARSYTRRTAIARALQHGLLPPELPDVPGWSAAVLYRPAGEFNEVGGDFYDVFAGPKGWMLLIGDVAGQGAEAAARTSLARFTLRTAGELTGDVSAAVARLNDTLRGQAGLPLCTVVFAALEEREDGTAVVTMASAGHPPPLLVRGSEVTPVGDPGTIAGAFDGERWPSAEVTLEPGDLLVLYTDGVTDAMGEDDRYGERRLREALGRLQGGVQERLGALRAELEAFERGPQRDDTTVLVLEYQGVGAQPDEPSRRAASSMTSARLQNAKRTSERPASSSS